MLLSQHVVVGAAIGVATGNPAMGFAGGLVSHHILDGMPHYDGGFFKDKTTNRSDLKWSNRVWKIVILDILFSGIILLYIAIQTNQWWLVGIGAFGGAFADIVDNVPWWSLSIRKTKIGTYYHYIHDKIHYNIADKGLALKIFTVILQLSLTAGGIWVSLLKH